MKKKTILLLMLFVEVVLYSQNTIEQAAQMNTFQLFSAAKHAERIGDWFSAITFYEAVLLNNETNKKAINHLAKLYFKTRDYNKALITYKKAQEIQAQNPENLFYIALLYKNIGDYEKSIEVFETFLKKSKQMKSAKRYKTIAKSSIEGSQYHLRNKNETSYFISILDTSINHAHIETAPQFIDEENVLFVTNRDNELHYYNDLDTNQKQPHRNIYQLSKTDNKWVFNNEYDYPFKNKNNVGSFAMSEDKKRLYISVCEFNWKNKLVCSIFISYNENGKWSEPKKIEGDVNLTQYTSTQPALGIDTKTGEEVLYFVSDRPGGRGGLDIWYTVFDSKRARFKNAKNLGNKINTVGDEVTPFYRSSDRLLCFSSDGWPGNGGLDVFKTHGELKKWGEISHLPPGINSSYDDLNFTSSKHDNSGLFTSNRPGGVKLFNETCCDDLYEFTDIANVQIFLTGNIISLKDSSFYQFLAEKQLIDKDVLDEINDKLVYLFILDKNSEEEPILIGVDTIANNKYNFRLEPNTEYLLRIPDFDFSHSIITGLNSDTIFCTDTLKDFISDKPIVINNIYYEFDDYRLNDQSKSIIDTTIYELLDKFPYINIEILSHTDAKGDDDYNMTLSQKRAESVVKYLVSKGIKVERLNATGYGEDKPIAPNFNEDGSDNSEGRARNRRTEFRIIQKVNKKIIYSNE